MSSLLKMKDAIAECEGEAGAIVLGAIIETVVAPVAVAVHQRS